MAEQPAIFIGKGESPQYLLLHFANRHGLIACATGTGKTISLQVLAEGFSSCGVPVFMADIKGDLSGISYPGNLAPRLVERAEKIGLEPYESKGFPTMFWDIFGDQGHPMRATVSDMGPVFLSRLLELNETQEGVLNVAFKLADDQRLRYFKLLLQIFWLLKFISTTRCPGAFLSTGQPHSICLTPVAKTIGAIHGCGAKGAAILCQGTEE
jgi:uncharacterized protein